MKNLIRALAGLPVFLVGFRPFFTLAMISAVVFPLAWVLVFTGQLSLPSTGISPVQWHAHEMLYGFGWAVLGGFLLTASKNWVKIRGLHGGPLALLVAAWLLERAAFLLLPSNTPEFIRFISLNLFLLAIVAYLVQTLIRYRHQDSFKDNGFFIVGLPLFIFAKNIMLNPDTFIAGYTLSIGLFRLAFAVMFERTVTQFMKNAMNVELLRSRLLDGSIKGLVLLAAFEAFFPPRVAALLLALAALLLAIRWFLWKPLLGMRQFGIAIMYLGYLGLVVHLALEALKLSGVFEGIGALSVHVFTFICMGLVIPGMFIRISQGHTGRKLLFATSDRIAIALMGGGAFFRLVATQAWPDRYQLWIVLAGLGWALCFALLAVRLTPFLWQPRIDGREH